MNPIFQALAQGYQEEDILNHLIKTIPSIAPRVKRAKKSGHSTKGILDFISQDMEEEAQVDLQASNRISAKQKRRSEEVTKSLVKGGLKLGSLAFGAGMLARSAPQMLSRFPALQRFLGVSAPAETATAPVAGAMEAKVVSPPPTPAQEAMLAKAPVSYGQGVWRDYLETKGLDKRLKNLKRAGKSREEMVEFLKEKMPIGDQEYLRQIGFTGKPGNLEEKLGNVVDAYFPTEGEEYLKTGKFPETPDLTPKEKLERAKKEFIEKRSDLPWEKRESKEKIGSEIITPEGDIGTVEALPGKTAKVNIDGKRKIVKSKDLQESPVSKDELAQLYDDLLRGVESHTGEQVSRNVNFAGYDSINNELVYTPHSGTTYVYPDIPQDEADNLLSLMNRKTTGENYIGAWEEGTESPIGAALSKLIQRLVKERGRGKEYSRKYPSIYDALKPAREALKEIHRRGKRGKR